jgi:chemotaxis protein CheD
VAAQEIMVRMGELATTAEAGVALVSIGLGSCIGLALLDRGKALGGLAHVMLPVAPPAGHGGMPGKFADHAVDGLLAALLPLGARRHRLEAVLVGGARMFSIGATMDVGSRNEAAVRDALKIARIPIVAASTSGSTGRTIRVHPADGLVTVKAAGAKDEPLFGGATASARARIRTGAPA